MMWCARGMDRHNGLAIGQKTPIKKPFSEVLHCVKGHYFSLNTCPSVMASKKTRDSLSTVWHEKIFRHLIENTLILMVKSESPQIIDIWHICGVIFI